jgi:hypothetical protein
MRIFVNSDEGGKPFELFTSKDNQLCGWCRGRKGGWVCDIVGLLKR